MLTFLIVALVLAVVVGTVGFIGIGSATIEIGKMLLFCAIVLMLISAVVDVVRGKARS